MPTRALLVIPTLNEAAHIAGVLNQLLDTRDDSVRLRVVVADGGSEDDTPQLVSQLARRDARVRLLHNPARIQSAAVNLAVRRYGEENDVLIRCDAHADYPPRFCARLVETLER